MTKQRLEQTLEEVREKTGGSIIQHEDQVRGIYRVSQEETVESLKKELKKLTTNYTRALNVFSVEASNVYPGYVIRVSV